MITRRPAIPCVLFLLLTLTVGSLRAASYYVDYAGGSDASTGLSPTTAWRHCPGDPAASGGPAGVNLAAGDTVYFKGGVSYVFTGATGIDLKWNGTSTAPITYDGNSGGVWGTGRARLTDNYGTNGIVAFSASTAVANLAFRSLEFVGIGGSASLPHDSGFAVSPRFGAGIDFKVGASNTVIDGCLFHNLGYFFNAKPMNAAAINGVGVRFASLNGVTISGCEFTQVASAIEMYGASSLANVTVSSCTFHDGVVWPIDLPPAWVKPTSFQVIGCAETNNGQFSSNAWLGYGPSPRTTARTAHAGTYVGMSVTFAATPTVTFQWRKNGALIAGATTANLGLSAVAAADAGTYTVVATNAEGTSTSNDIVLAVAAATMTTVTASPAVNPVPTSTVTTPIAPVVVSLPAGPSSPAPTTASSSPTTTLPTTSSPTPAPTPASVTPSPATPAPTQVATDPAPATPNTGNPTPAATPSPSTPTGSTQPPSRLTNVSVRGHVSATSGPLIVGFVVNGSAEKSLLIRAVGPALAHYGVSDALGDPGLSLYSGRSLLAQNVKWNSSPDAARVTTAASSVGAFPLAPESADAAMSPSLNAGAYTAHVTSAARHDGTALVEVYDVDRGVESKLVNVSVRADVGSGAGNPIIGFVVEGPTSKRLLIRAVGPSLTAFGVTNALADPRLTLVRASTVVASNDNWNGDQGVADAAASVAAFPLSVQSSKDSAIVVDVAPGVYSTVVDSVDKTEGVVIVEVYELP